MKRDEWSSSKNKVWKINFRFLNETKTVCAIICHPVSWVLRDSESEIIQEQCNITCHLIPETPFSSNFNVGWNLTFDVYGKSHWLGTRCVNKILFLKKASIIFQTSGIIGVSGVSNWISQTCGTFCTLFSPAYLSYKFASLLHCISHLSDLTLSSILLIQAYYTLKRCSITNWFKKWTI